MIDVGVLTAARLGIGNGDAEAPDPSLKQVIAPGLYWRISVGGPLVVGAGGTIIPDLRKDDAGNRHTAFRVVGFIGLDVTILPF